MPKTTVVIPTYNEADNLPAITAALFELNIDDLDILVVDDGSPDGTGQVAEKLGEQYNGRVSVIHRPGKLGLGTAYVEGFNRAISCGADYIIQMDADFSHSPSYIPQFLEWIKTHDVVVGSRYVRGGELDKRWSWWRWFLSWWANSVWVKMILGSKTSDATAGFKCWRRAALQSIELSRIRSGGYIFQVEMCYAAEKLGLRIKEIPIYFEDRRIGQSKMSMKVKLEAALRVFEIRWRYRGGHLIARPVEGR
ncbi:MAG: polyprenol monophosphomannose synthase [Chloroflexi bacterium]|nr:polyprenol monophosphomannose synthase [Chloroflexota bacterium]